MKKLSLLLILMTMTFGAFAQNFAVIDEDFQNAPQAQARYYAQQTCLVKNVAKLAGNQINSALEGKMVANLHIYASTEPGSINFCNMTINAENLKENAFTLLQMASYVSDRIIIHSPNVFTTEQGIAFKTQLEQLTGLTVTSI